MKTILIILSLSVGFNGFGQTPCQLTKTDLIQIETEVERVSQMYKEALLKNDYLEDSFKIEFATDTFRIEHRHRLKLNIDNSTNGMVISTLDASREYEKLLNKYYILLLNSLNEEDKEILIKSQKNWNDFKDSELELNGVLMNDYYSGGGTIQRIFAAARVLEITRDRVIELYHYLNRKTE